jgi:hypothetical protein
VDAQPSDAGELIWAQTIKIAKMKIECDWLESSNIQVCELEILLPIRPDWPLWDLQSSFGAILPKILDVNSAKANNYVCLCEKIRHWDVPLYTNMTERNYLMQDLLPSLSLLQPFQQAYSPIWCRKGAPGIFEFCDIFIKRKQKNLQKGLNIALLCESLSFVGPQCFSGKSTIIDAILEIQAQHPSDCVDCGRFRRKNIGNGRPINFTTHSSADCTTYTQFKLQCCSGKATGKSSRELED